MNIMPFDLVVILTEKGMLKLSKKFVGLSRKVFNKLH